MLDKLTMWSWPQGTDIETFLLCGGRGGQEVSTASSVDSGVDVGEYDNAYYAKCTNIPHKSWHNPLLFFTFKPKKALPLRLIRIIQWKSICNTPFPQTLNSRFSTDKSNESPSKLTSSSSAPSLLQRPSYYSDTSSISSSTSSRRRQAGQARRGVKSKGKGKSSRHHVDFTGPVLTGQDTRKRSLSADFPTSQLRSVPLSRISENSDTLCESSAESDDVIDMHLDMRSRRVSCPAKFENEQRIRDSDVFLKEKDGPSETVVDMLGQGSCSETALHVIDTDEQDVKNFPSDITVSDISASDKSRLDSTICSDSQPSCTTSDHTLPQPDHYQLPLDTSFLLNTDTANVHKPQSSRDIQDGRLSDHATNQIPHKEKRQKVTRKSSTNSNNKIHPFSTLV